MKKQIEEKMDLEAQVKSKTGFTSNNEMLISYYRVELGTLYINDCDIGTINKELISFFKGIKNKKSDRLITDYCSIIMYNDGSSYSLHRRPKASPAIFDKENLDKMIEDMEEECKLYYGESNN